MGIRAVMLRGLLIAAGFGLFAEAQAHPLAPALLELKETGAGQYEVLWRSSIIRARGGDVAPVLPDHCTAQARARTTVENGEALVARWPVHCGEAGVYGNVVRIAGIEGSGINVILRFLPLHGEIQTALLDAQQPAYAIGVADNTRPFFSYLALGMEHLLTGLDHALFVLGLLLLVRGGGRLVATVTAFTLGHSLTLGLAALGLIYVDAALMELGIALSLLWLACELPRRGNTPPSRFWARPWRMACVFGLLHGLGFAGALADVGLPPADIPLALLGFNVGIELGQLLLIGAALFLASAVRRLGALPALSLAAVRAVLVYGMGVAAVFWSLERAAAFLA